MQTFDSSFIGNFKLGDNIKHNLDSLVLLYSYYKNETSENQVLLRKLMLIQKVSVVEAIIYDFRYRAIHFTSEKINGVSDELIADISLGNKRKLNELIDCMKKHQIFGDYPTFYSSLNELRQLRNRVHIQNEKKHFERDDAEAFNENKKILAEQILEKVCKDMTTCYSRGKKMKYVQDFNLPWQEHLD